MDEAKKENINPDAAMDPLDDAVAAREGSPPLSPPPTLTRCDADGPYEVRMGEERRLINVPPKNLCVFEIVARSCL